MKEEEEGRKCVQITSNIAWNDSNSNEDFHVTGMLVSRMLVQRERDRNKSRREWKKMNRRVRGGKVINMKTEGKRSH